MGLLEDLSDVGPWRIPTRCRVGKIYLLLLEQDPKVAQVFLDKVNDRSIDQAVLIGVLKEYGHELSKYGLTRHRRNDCLCAKDLGL